MKIFIFKNEEQIEEVVCQEGSNYMFGRGEDCDVQLEDIPGISRHHFQITQTQKGQWIVYLLSKVGDLKCNQKSCKEILLDKNLDFYVDPYRFQCIVMSLKDVKNPIDLLDKNFSQKNSKLNSFQDKESEISNNEKTFLGNEEKTSFQKFVGQPYIKIIGENGSASEFLRLEGTFWTVGQDKNSSIHINQGASEHFEIFKKDQGFFIKDLGSVIGTLINGTKISSHQPTPLESGDIIGVKNQFLQFELRDQEFKEKVEEVATSVYKNPFFLVQDEENKRDHVESQISGVAEEVSTLVRKKIKLQKKHFLMFLAVIFIFVIQNQLKNNSKKEEKITVEKRAENPFSKLSLKDKKFISQNYKLAKQFYLSKNFNMALAHIQKIHKIIPDYKESLKIQSYCINAIDLAREKALIETQKKEEENLKMRVRSLLSQCSKKFSNSYEYEKAKLCLNPIFSIEPNNTEVNEILNNIVARKEEREVRRKIQKERRSKVLRGRQLYDTARTFHKNKLYIKAIQAYENHIHSGLPDPQNFVQRSKRNLASLEKLIRDKKMNLMKSSRLEYKSDRLKEAIYLARQALNADPYDYSISVFINKISKKLSGKMREIYMDSVIEERFGNMEAGKKKWKKILDLDVEDGKYYKKAKKKLEEYGFR